MAERGFEAEREMLEGKPEIGESKSESQSTRPIWAIPNVLFSWPHRTNPDSRPFLENLGFEILDGVAVIKYGLFPVSCYQVSPPIAGWTRIPDKHDVSHTITDPSGKAVLQVEYQTDRGDWSLGDLHYGVKIL